ncbi:MAG: radical SAM protein, partial [Pseudomonadota bacterium]
MTKPSFRRPRVLVVIAHFDEMRQFGGRPHFFPQGVSHAYLAGAFHPQTVELDLYSEFHSGPLMDQARLARADMVVLTGVTSAFDRMKHITAHARVANPSAVVVAGGPAVRNLPVSAQKYFDYAALGDIEEMGEIAGEVFGPDAVNPNPLPRFDLMGFKGPITYVESTRYCNFRCSFCALTGEGRGYQTYDMAYIRAQITSQPKGKYLLFIDNNFLGSNMRHYAQKLELLEELYRDGWFKGWIALVTNDFYARKGLLEQAAKAGCVGLFSGVETLDPEQLKRYDKKQNLALPQMEAIERCLEAGIVYQYGMIFDPSEQTVAEMEDQMGFLIDHHRIPLPAFMSMTIPLLGTPIFDQVLAAGRFLPSTRLRDMDGVTQVLRPQNDLHEVTAFIKRMKKLDWARGRILKRSWAFYQHYRRHLNAKQMGILLGNGARLISPSMNVNNMAWLPGAREQEERTYVTTTQPLSRLYSPNV